MRPYLKAILLVLFNATALWVPTYGSVQCSADNTCTNEEKKQSALRMVKAYLKRGEERDMDAALQESRLVLSGSLPPDVLEEVLSQAKEETERKFRPDQSGYADRHLIGLQNTVSDPDCMSREFDIDDLDYDAKEAVGVFRKCKILVLRNMFDLDFLEEYKKKLTGFIHGLNEGRISPFGGTSHAEKFYITNRGDKRWEINLPKDLASEMELVTDQDIIELITDPGILGSVSDIILLSNTVLLAQPGHDGEPFRKGDSYLFENSLQSRGFGGHDLPSYAVSIMVPMLDMTPEHGPTEFCVGSSYLDGMDDLGEDIKVRDQSLIAEGSFYQEFWNTFVNDWDGPCPSNMVRSPVLKFGDIIIFDYQIYQRGGLNTSPDMSALIEMTYSRSWYRDGKYFNSPEEKHDDYDDILEEEKHDDDVEEEKIEEETKEAAHFRDLHKQLIRNSRFGQPDDERDCTDGCDVEHVELENIQNFLSHYGEVNYFSTLSGVRKESN